MKMIDCCKGSHNSFMIWNPTSSNKLMTTLDIKQNGHKACRQGSCILQNDELYLHISVNHWILWDLILQEEIGTVGKLVIFVFKEIQITGEQVLATIRRVLKPRTSQQALETCSTTLPSIGSQVNCLIRSTGNSWCTAIKKASYIRLAGDGISSDIKASVTNGPTVMNLSCGCHLLVSSYSKYWGEL